METIQQYLARGGTITKCDPQPDNNQASVTGKGVNGWTYLKGLNNTNANTKGK